jgi:hypothetical protein
MATVTFRVIPQKNRTYHVELVRPDGSRRTITGFRSEHEAQAWGIQAERMDQCRSTLAGPASCVITDPSGTLIDVAGETSGLHQR